MSRHPAPPRIHRRLALTTFIALVTACGGQGTATQPPPPMDANGSDDLGSTDTSIDASSDAATDVAPDVSVVDATTDLAAEASPDVPEPLDALVVDALVPDVPALDVDTCTDAGTRCPGPDGGASLCVELPTDPANCGRCGNTCVGGQLCVGGACACPTGRTLCEGLCVDTSASNAHCGACGTQCPAAQSCVSGACACPTGQTFCDGACVDTTTSGANCGRCGNACPAAQSCVSGACACPTGQTFCDGACVDTSASGAHCGRCGNACPSAQMCVSGMCACPMGQALCGGACVTTDSDPSNCGSCGTACPTGQLCVAGSCALSCTAPRTVCGAGAAMACVDTRSDESNCGACGTRCPAGRTCAAGACACAGETTSCGEGASAVCVDTRSDDAHCGACNRRCGAGAHAASARCLAGLCVSTCEPGFADCDGDASNGCEVDTRSDAMNCGACGTACPAAGGARRCFGSRCAANGGCAALLASSPGLANGVYLIDVDGDGPSTPTPLYCDMTGGGWTLVVNQVPGAPLPDTNDSVNIMGFGALDQSWRLGNPDITRVRPTVSWKLSDATNNVYVSPMCVVDWSRNYTDTMVATACTVGYTSTALTTIVNGRWVYCSARGIGINNSGMYCSIRASEGGPASQGAMPHGRAASCNYTITERVSLWYR